MDAKSLRTLNKYQNALKKRFIATKKTIELSLDTLDIINNLYDMSMRLSHSMPKHQLLSRFRGST